MVQLQPARGRRLRVIVRLPFSDDPGALDSSYDTPGVDTSLLDWTQVRRSAYIIHQRISYRYDGPVRLLRQRLVVQPRERHGDQRRVSRSVRIVDATPRMVRAGSDDFGNHVVDIEVPYVAEQVTFISSSIVERRTDHEHLTSGALLHDRRLLDTTPLTAADGDLDALIR